MAHRRHNARASAFNPESACAMPDSATRPAITGSAPLQGDLWSVRAADYAAVQEPLFLPLYEALRRRPEVARAGALLDVGCGPSLGAQTMATTIDRVAGMDASAAFIAMARERLPHGEFLVGEMESLPHGDGTFDVVTGSMPFNTRPLRRGRCARRAE
jgi:SAM-dependent methyltransferase